MPDFFIVGHPKCGTTALYEMLRGHPQIFMPDLKEPCSSPATCGRASSRRGPRRRRRRSRTIFALFAPARAASSAPARPRRPTCCSHDRRRRDRRAASRRADRRDPARAGELPALAAHPAAAHARRDRAGPRAGDRARAGERRRRQAAPAPLATGRSCCSTPTTCATSSSCAATTTRSAREQVLVLIYDDFRADNEAVLRNVLRHLGVEEHLALPALEANPTFATRSQRADELLHAVSHGEGALVGALKRAVPQHLRRQALSAVQRRLVWREPAGRRRAADPEPAPAAGPGGPRPQRVPQPRPRDAVGLRGARLGGR